MALSDFSEGEVVEEEVLIAMHMVSGIAQEIRYVLYADLEVASEVSSVIERERAHVDARHLPGVEPVPSQDEQVLVVQDIGPLDEPARVLDAHPGAGRVAIRAVLPREVDVDGSS